MASYGPRLINRIKRLLSPSNSTKGKGEAPNSQEKAKYGESLIKNSFINIHKLQLLKNFQHQQFQQNTWKYSSTFVQGDRDEAMEVFLDHNGQIKRPYERAIAFEFCKIDRWYMPDCVPGILSRVDITHAGRPDERPDKPQRVITVLHAEGQYIHLAPGKPFLIEPDDEYYQAVEAHFVRRGIEFIRDGIDISGWAQTFGTYNGQRNKKTGITSTGTGRGQHSNTPVIAQWGPDFADFSISYTIAEVKANRGSWTSGGP